MSGIKGIAKNLSALFSGHAINILQNLVQVPFFIHSYGTAGYGEWLALSAAVSYLGTLDFGVQTYVNQDLTVRYHRGEMVDFHVRQSTALRLLLGIVASVAALGTLTFFLPLQQWLRMDGSVGNSPILSAEVVHWAVYLLALQMLVNIPAGYFFGTFMVIGKAYIGGYWSNVKNLLLFISTISLVWFHASFKSLALAQLFSVAVAMLAAMVHLRAIAPDIFPTLRFWDGASVRTILSQSGYFALIYSSNFLVYQVPIVILQRSLGPIVVALFSIMRTIFSMTRTQMSTLSQAMAPEITTLYARKDWPVLSSLYNYSERLIFSLIPMVNIGALYLSPFLLTVWIHGAHGRGMFLPQAYLLCAAVTITMSIKEHKYNFQVSSNTHKELGLFMFGSYMLMGALWIVVIPHFGIYGLLWVWLGIEMCQLIYTVWLNMLLFKSYEQLELKYLVRILVFSATLLLISTRALIWSLRLPLSLQVVATIALCGVIFMLDFPLFHLVPVLRKFRERLKQRSVRRSASQLEQQTLL
jgi:O-antigen/teichoic acid export membrane protein